MSFLQPMLLAALPLVALPIIIHLINQRRYQTVRWGAMMFLIAANRMSRGFARLRQWLIMAFRMAAIAGLLFAVSRPLAGGWLGLAAGNRADTTIILLDRSPSMQQVGPDGGGSKLMTARQQLARTLETLGSNRWLLIESGSNRPIELESPQDLLTTSAAEPTSAQADLPAMFLAARDYIQSNKPGRTEIWICSDLRENDWNAEGGRWQSLRDGFLEFSQAIRFHLLAYPEVAAGNLAVQVTSVRRQTAGESGEILVSLRLAREGIVEGRQSIPIQFEIDGARSELTIDMDGPRFELKDHRIPVERGHVRGWGRVSIPADANPADNDDWFVFDEPAPRAAVIVGDDPQVVRPLQLASAIPPDPTVKCSVEVVAEVALPAVEWEKVAMILWTTPPPRADSPSFKLITTFLERGGQVIFLPPRNPTADEFLGIHWTSWKEHPAGLLLENWRGDQDLLAQTQNGSPLPVGQIQVRRSCGLSGEFTALASLRGGDPLLARAATTSGGVYFLATTTAPSDSTFATNGVVLYVLLQRALAQGAQGLGNTRLLQAGDPAGEDPSTWRVVAGVDQALSSEYALHRGVYRSGERLLAVRRPVAEDLAPVLADDRVAGLFRGLDFARLDDRAGSLSGLIQEIWRIFLVAMMVAMVVEAGLCLPKRRSGGSGA